jgi:ankyrin repeat domain-containing protein 50
MVREHGFNLAMVLWQALVIHIHIIAALTNFRKLALANLCLRESSPPPTICLQLLTLLLRSNVIEHITTHRALEKEVGICFAYYNYQSPEMQESSQIIPALIKQLCRKKDSVPPGFLRIKQDSLNPSTLGNQESFIAVAQEFEECFLLMDGLDECSREKRHHVLGFLSAIVKSLPRAKIFVTSRRETDLIRAFEQMRTPMIEVEAKNVEEDISTYVTYEIERLCNGYNGKKLYVKSKALEQKIIETLTAKAEGM